MINQTDKILIKNNQVLIKLKSTLLSGRLNNLKKIHSDWSIYVVTNNSILYIFSPKIKLI